MAEIATGQTHWQDSHLLVELHTTDSLVKPIHGSTRIQVRYVNMHQAKMVFYKKIVFLY